MVEWLNFVASAGAVVDRVSRIGICGVGKIKQLIGYREHLNVERNY